MKKFLRLPFDAANFSPYSLGRCLLVGCCCGGCSEAEADWAELAGCLSAEVAAVAGAGLGATEDEAVEAEGGREATRLVGDLVRPPKANEIMVHIKLTGTCKEP